MNVMGDLFGAFALLAGGFIGYLFGWRRRVLDEMRAPGKKPATVVVAEPTFDRRTAAHEAGHALAALCSTYVDRVTRAEVHDKGGLVNYRTSFGEGLDPCLRGYWSALVIDLAGIAAEMLVYGSTRSKECEKDLLIAREHAEAIVQAGSLGKFPFKRPSEVRAPDFGKIFADGLPQAEADVMRLGYAYARALIVAHRTLFDAIFERLVREGVLEEDALLAIFGDRKLLCAIGRATGHFFI